MMTMLTMPRRTTTLIQLVRSVLNRAVLNYVVLNRASLSCGPCAAESTGRVVVVVSALLRATQRCIQVAPLDGIQLHLELLDSRLHAAAAAQRKRLSCGSQA